jgi:hypothetical protein
MRRTRAFSIAAAATVVLWAASTGWAAFPEYLNQNSSTSNYHSGISTSDGKTVWDVQLSSMVAGPSGSPLMYDEMAFAFMECYGGGMIDELTAQFSPASFTSASRHNELSWNGTRDTATSGKRESYYNVHYSPWVGGSLARTHGQAAGNAHDNDIVGPVIQNTLKEHPQYLFNYPLLDRTDITLHRPNMNTEPTGRSYLAVLFGGSAVASSDSAGSKANFNSLARLHTDLLARGYTSNDIYLMWPMSTDPWGNALPSTWAVDDGTTYQDMQDAWTWVNANSTLNTQVYFWSTISHGSRTNNLPSGSGAGEAPGAPLPFDLDAEFVGQVTELFDFFGGGDGTAQGQPYFQVIAHRDIPDLVVTLNGRVLALMETADVSIGADPQFFHKFALDSADIAALAVAGNVVDFQYTGDPAEFVLAGVTTGSMSNAIPEPATLSLLALGGLAVLRRRRKR